MRSYAVISQLCADNCLEVTTAVCAWSINGLQTSERRDAAVMPHVLAKSATKRRTLDSQVFFHLGRSTQSVVLVEAP